MFPEITFCTVLTNWVTCTKHYSSSFFLFCLLFWRCEYKNLPL